MVDSARLRARSISLSIVYVDEQRAIAAVDELALLGELLLALFLVGLGLALCLRSGRGSMRLTGTPCLSSWTLALFDGLGRYLVRVMDHALLVDPLVGGSAGRRRERQRSGHEQREARREAKLPKIANRCPVHLCRLP